MGSAEFDEQEVSTQQQRRRDYYQTHKWREVRSESAET
jgi:hypothetical protein